MLIFPVISRISFTTPAPERACLGAEFEISVGKLGPLRERIAATDRLIDAVVYRLYGLTEEEIAIVEKKTQDKVASRNSEISKQI